VHALVTGTRRSRHEFAVLRGLGLRRRQVWSAIGWQVLTIVATAVAIGIPIGLLAGHLGWQRFASSLGVEAHAGIPAVLLILVLGGALAVGAVAAVVPAYLATRIRPAQVLRAAT
jgi:ABC-type antimicrobial peptide transport system permease subunit